MIYGKRTMDCPGSYVENADMYKHLIAAFTGRFPQCSGAGGVESRPIDIYSPKFAQAFTKPVIGAIAEVELGTGERRILLAASCA